MMTFDKAKRILPSFVSHCANGISDLSVLRARVIGAKMNQETLLMHKLGQVPAALISEVKAIDLKLEQLNRFLDAAK